MHFGHWLPGAADFLGEEQEQVFATQGPRANTSKHMSRAGIPLDSSGRLRLALILKTLIIIGRRDDVSASLFYHNEEKDLKLPEFLVKCYNTVS